VNAVEVRDLSKNYLLEGSQLSRMRHLMGAGKLSPKDGIWALRNVSFSVARGEAFGIIGTNGSGKSTLLQIVAGILRPTSGSAQVNGRVSALLELGSGFSPEFTGRDNVYLNGSLLGLSRDEIDARFADIEMFAGIGDFISQPIKTYSSGMVLRLAFAVAVHVDPEVVIVDEALAVGDIAFRLRCMRKIHDLRARGTTILFVSHETTDVKALCERCLWLQNGIVQDLGKADDVVARYLSSTLHREAQREALISESATPLAKIEPADAAAPEFVFGFPRPQNGHRYGDGRIKILGAELIDDPGTILRLTFRGTAPVTSPIAGFLFRNGKGENIFGSNTARENYPLPTLEAGDTHNVDFHWTMPELAPGVYWISLAVSDGNLETFRVCDYMEDAIELRVRDRGQAGMVSPRGYFHLRCATVTVHHG
jgi:lipopolysaccharide transport system ATP-binding protein